MVEILRGDTKSPVEDSSLGGYTTNSGGASDKKSAYAAMVDKSNAVGSIANEMGESNLLAKETNRVAKQSQLIMLAQHLGKEEILEGLLEDLASRGVGG
jgi:hypothetical protein